MTRMSKLLPCPFCGSEYITVFPIGAEPNLGSVARSRKKIICEQCGCTLDSVDNCNEWNNRVEVVE